MVCFMFFAGVCSSVAGLASSSLRFDDAFTACNLILQRREQSARSSGLPKVNVVWSAYLFLL